MAAADHPRVVSLSRSAAHTFTKAPCTMLRLITGLGVAGDAHAGSTVKHRSRVARDPTQPNLRQVHVIPSELLVELSRQGFDIRPGDIGENVLTAGIDLFALPRGTLLRLGADAEIEITGLRNPCHQLDGFRAGLMQALLPRDENGKVTLRGGIMAVVVRGGTVHIDDAVAVTLPTPPHQALQRV